MAAQRHGFVSKWWGTFNQWRKLGGKTKRRPDNIPSGQWGTQIVFWTPIVKAVEEEHGEKREDKFFAMKVYTVFNIDQVDGSHLDHLRADHDPDGEPTIPDYEPAETAIASTCADIRYGGDRAIYSLVGDFIQCPARTSFEGTSEYYQTIFHELVHWTEHPTRLNWSRKEADNSYALGELVAEVGGCHLAQELCVPQSDDLTNHTAYLQHWLQAMRGDSRFIFTASAQASKATDFILSFSRQTEPEPEPALAE
jgi:antirestriction protein ArdC